MTTTNTSTHETKCPLCLGKAELRYQGMKGYIVDDLYDVYECLRCSTTFVDPMRTDATVYQHIYRQVDQMPGYERYARYAQLVTEARDPLRLLANAEGAYWAVVRAVEMSVPVKQGATVLEIGSGLGYLTYALNKSGYTTTGIDISLEAVHEARKRYGNHYAVKDLFNMHHEHDRYDCVIMMEVIEHVEDPKRFITAALALLKSGGKLIVTTPNKTAAPPNTIWHSDFPPVHLWFMAEATLEYIAASCGRGCTFVDFTDYSKKFYSPQYAGTIDTIQAGLPRLERDGSIRPEVVVSRRKTRFFGLYGRYLLSYIRRRLKRKTISSRATTMCAIIS